MLLAARELPPGSDVVDLYVALGKRDSTRVAFELAREARRAGLQAQIELAGRSLKGQLKHADRIHARWVAIVGANGDAMLKDMESGEQQDTPLQEIIPTITRRDRLQG
jgi:histidyl-tRNA synthetase